jgi:hypothetical protein
LRAAVGVNLQLVAAATNVGEETRVFEHRYSGLAVEKDPRRGNEIVALGRLSKSELGEFNAGTCVSVVWSAWRSCTASEVAACLPLGHLSA